MRAATLTLILFSLFPGTSLAGQVYGTLRDSGRPVGANIKVEIVCGSNAYSAMTDNYGSYKLFARENGKCAFRVYYQNQMPQTTIDSYADAAHYDFDLVLTGGRYELRRK
jgi:hypothetical protein